MVQFALFGSGYIGNVHAHNILRNPQAQLSLIYDVSASSAIKLAKKTGAKVVESPNEIWKSDVDAIVIASSTNTHSDLLHAAMKAQKSIFCEKPIDLNINRVKKVVQQSKNHKLPIFIGFSRRYDHNHLELKKMVDKGKIGKLEMIHLTSRGPTPPPISYVKVSGGQFRDQTIHFFDLLCWVTNDVPVEVYATGAALVDPQIGKAGDIDTSMLILKMSKGGFCHIDNSRRASYGYDEKIEVFGSSGMVQSKRKPIGETTFYNSQKQIVSEGLHQGWFERMEPTFGTAMDHFVKLVESKGKGKQNDFPSLLDGLRAQIIAEAAIDSLKKNQPVKINYWKP